MRTIALIFAGSLALAACAEIATVDSAAPSQDKYNRVMDIVNDTGVTMTKFFASGSTTRSWGRNRLSDTPFLAGQYRTFNFADGAPACVFEFKAVFEDGSERLSDKINVCVESSWRAF